MKGGKERNEWKRMKGGGKNEEKEMRRLDERRGKTGKERGDARMSKMGRKGQGERARRTDKGKGQWKGQE